MKYLKRPWHAAGPAVSSAVPRPSVLFIRAPRAPMKHSGDAFASFSPPLRHTSLLTPPFAPGESIFSCYALVVLLRTVPLTSDELPKLEHPSSRKSVRTGESSSIKGPISDDKDRSRNEWTMPLDRLIVLRAWNRHRSGSANKPSLRLFC